MSDTFTVEMKKDPEIVLKRLKDKLAEVDGSITGTASSGSFEGQTPFGPLKGSYAISGSALTITIAEKPAFLTAGLIEATMRKYLG